MSAENATMNQHGDSNLSSNQTISSDPPGAGPKLLKLRAVRAMVSLSRSSIYGKIAQETFPEQTKTRGYPPRIGLNGIYKKSL